MPFLVYLNPTFLNFPQLFVQTFFDVDVLKITQGLVLKLSNYNEEDNISPLTEFEILLMNGWIC